MHGRKSREAIGSQSPVTVLIAASQTARPMAENEKTVLKVTYWVEPAQVKTADCCALDTWWDRRPFERILADVPCSASGVVRRHPDSKWLRRATDIAGFARSQAEILEALWHVLAPGGKMLYCTCSLFPEENELQIASFAARHADALRIPLNDGAARGDSLQWQVLPQAEQDGFFYALVQKHR